MNAEQRAALRKLAEEATPGPWYCKHNNEAWSAIVLDAGSNFGFIDAWSSPVVEGVQCSAEQLSNYIAAANPSTILQLLDYIETLEKDAARYRWLRDTCMDDPKTRLAVMNGFIDYETVDYIYGEGLDVAIDAAMKG